MAVWHLVWVLNEVPMGLNACQVIRSHHSMTLSDHLIAHHEHMPSYLSHLRKSSSHSLRVNRIWDAKHDLQIRIKSSNWSEVCEKYWNEKNESYFVLFRQNQKYLINNNSHTPWRQMKIYLKKGLSALSKESETCPAVHYQTDYRMWGSDKVDSSVGEGGEGWG